MKVFGANYWDQGGLITGGSGELYLRDDAGLRYDFADGKWKEIPTRAAGIMVEDANSPGYYLLSVDPSGWGNRIITGQSRLFKDGCSDQVDTHHFAVTGGYPAIPVYVPNPGQGVQVILAVRNPDGTPSRKMPDAFLTVVGPADDMAAAHRDPVWDETSGGWVWIVPSGCQVLVSCMDLGICGLYAVGQSPLMVNTAKSLA
jgi:hypothetical protein